MIPKPFVIRISSDDHCRLSDLSKVGTICVGGKEFSVTEFNIGAHDAVVFAQEVVKAEWPWDGEGLPPAGTVCELRNVAAETGWSQATVAFASRNVIVWDWAGEPAINGLCTAYAHAVEMRPIRTPEQIAADERTKAIDELVKVTCINRGEAARIYDAGYRKQETE